MSGVRSVAASVLALALLAAAGCGKYGPPERNLPPEPQAAPAPSPPPAPAPAPAPAPEFDAGDEEAGSTP